jgi:hypothetical protein
MGFLDLPVSSPYTVIFLSLIGYSMYNFLAFLGILFFYFPEKNHQALPGPKRDILKNIDYVGAALSIAGATLL